MTNPLETISPENKDSLERLNDERMHNGLEAVPVEPIEGAHDQRGEEPKESDKNDKSLLADLQLLFYPVNHLLNIVCTLDDIDYELVCCGVVKYKDAAASQLKKAIDELEDEIEDFVSYNVDELASIEFDTVEDCANALELFGRNKVMREIITRNLRNLAGAQ